MKVLLIATYSVCDHQLFQFYRDTLMKLTGVYGGELICSGKKKRTLAGQLEHEGLVIFSFPGQRALNRWFDSEENQSLIALRQQSARMTMISYNSTHLSGLTLTST